MRGSGINDSHDNCGKRAGRLFDALRGRRCTARRAKRCASCARRSTIEANSATDNPMVFADTGDIVSGGNFHGAPVALAADLLAAAIAQLATISERRTDRLVNPALSGLPAFLTRDGGLQVGPDDGAGHGRGAHLRAQDARASGRRRHDSDLGEQGRPRQHEHGGGAEGGTRRCDARAT